MEWCCYVLGNPSRSRTYCGSTNNLERRLRQHRGQLQGGARYTTRHGPSWDPTQVVARMRPPGCMIAVYGFTNASQARSLDCTREPIKKISSVMEYMKHTPWFPGTPYQGVVQRESSCDHPAASASTGSHGARCAVVDATSSTSSVYSGARHAGGFSWPLHRTLHRGHGGEGSVFWW